MLLLTSCADSNSVDIHDENRYLDNCYTYMYLRNDDDEGNVIYRFNINTGEVTCVCPDPLCDHDINECVFASGSSFYVYDNNVIIPFRFVYDFETGSSWCEAEKYDLVSHKIETFYNYGHANRAYTAFSFIDGFMYGRHILDNTDKQTGALDGEDVIFRYDIFTDEIEYIDCFDEIPAFTYDGRYYFINELPFYSTDAVGKNRTTYDLPYLLYKPAGIDTSNLQSGFFSYIGNDKDGIFHTVKVDIDTGEYSAFELTRIRTAKIYKDFVYYIPVTDEYVMGFDEFNNKDIVNNTGGRLMRVPLSGGEPETVFDLGNEYFFSIVTILDVDGRLVIDYGGFDEHEMYHIQTWFETGGGKVVYDTATGEYTVFPRTWNKPIGMLYEQNIF